MDQETKDKIGLLQQSLWKLEAAKNLIEQALGESDATQLTNAAIEEIMEDIEVDIAELWDLQE